MARVTLDQKRLEALRRQLYGKETIGPEKLRKLKINQKVSKPESQIHWTAETQISSDVSSTSQSFQSSSNDTQAVVFLRKDLFKILSLSSLALCAQLLLYLATRNNLVNLAF